eukprot:6183805-Pleurochrysis_carterae.AAC.1
MERGAKMLNVALLSGGGVRAIHSVDLSGSAPPSLVCSLVRARLLVGPWDGGNSRAGSVGALRVVQDTGFCPCAPEVCTSDCFSGTEI